MRSKGLEDIGGLQEKLKKVKRVNNWLILQVVKKVLLKQPLETLSLTVTIRTVLTEEPTGLTHSDTDTLTFSVRHLQF